MKKTIFALCCIVALVSCKKTVEGPAGPQGPAGTNGTNGAGGTGMISGKVNQYDQYNVLNTTGLNTTTVSIDGTTITTVTDASGNYTLANLAAGIYDISYIKAGTGLDKNQQIVFPGSGTLYLNGSVTDLPAYTISSGYVKDTMISSNPYIRVNLNYTSAPKSRGAMIIIGNTNAVDITNPSSYKQTMNIQLNANSTVYTTSNSYATSVINSYPSGTILYAKVYPYSNGNYFDYSNSTTIYTGYGTPLPTTFTLTLP